MEERNDHAALVNYAAELKLNSLVIYCCATVLKLLVTLIHFSISFIYEGICLSDDGEIAGVTQIFPVILQVKLPSIEFSYLVVYCCIADGYSQY